MSEILEFKQAIHTGQIPMNLSLVGQALWYDGVGNWKKAHDLIDHLTDPPAAHVHAYLHRKEGDIWNADYWYSKAAQKRPDVSLETEWEQLVLLYVST